MPTRDTAWPNGTPCWVDYGAADVDAAKAFYEAILGWTFEGGDPAFGGYMTCLRDGRPAAGMAPQQDPADPPRWTTYFASDDVAAAAGRVTAAGGSLFFPPMEVGSFGSMVIAADPQGNPFGIWQAGQHTGFQVFNEPGSVVWNELGADDPESARVFYAAVFGFTYDLVDEGMGYTTFSTADRPLGGLSGAMPGGPKGWATCFSVAATDDAVATAEAAGAKVLMAASDTPYGRFAVLQDPWGAAFSVMQALPE